MPNLKIEKIERVQNRKLWRAFQLEIEEVGLKNREEVQIGQLFHGTRQNPPQLIYEGEEGFNINFSNGGSYGKAIYFAFNSSYSNGYAFPLPSGSK